MGTSSHTHIHTHTHAHTYTYTHACVLVLIICASAFLVVSVPLGLYLTPIYFEEGPKSGPLDAPLYYLVAIAVSTVLLVRTKAKLTKSTRFNTFKKLVSVRREGEEPEVAEAAFTQAVVTESLGLSLFSVNAAFVSTFLFVSKQVVVEYSSAWNFALSSTSASLLIVLLASVLGA